MKKIVDPRLYMLFGGLGFVLGAGLLFMQYSGLTEQEAKNERLTQQVRAQKDVPAQLAVSQRELIDLRAKLAHLEKDVPDFAYVPTLLREIESTGTQSGLKVVGVRPIDKSDALKAQQAKGIRKPYEELEIEVRARGTYASIQKMMVALNQFPKIVGARAVSVEPKPDPLRPRGEKPPLEVTVRLRAYLFPPVPGSSSGTEPATTPAADSSATSTPSKTAMVGGASNAG